MLETTSASLALDTQFSERDAKPHRSGGYIPILDGWRAVAIILVLLFHGLMNSDVGGNPILRVVAAVSGRTGALGVLIFFCISGFLITKRLRYESRAQNTFSLRAFYIKRVFRILPPLAFYLLTLLALFAAGLISLRVGDWAAPVFLTNYVSSSWYTSHFWSLSVEEHFYLFWPICVLVAGWRRAMWVGGALIFAVALWRPWELHHVTSQAKALQHTDMRLDYIMMGCVTAIAIEFYPIVGQALRKLGSSLGLLSLFLALILSTRPSPVDLRSVQAAILTLMVCGSSLANARIPKLLLGNPVMLFLGRISYSLYIWQQLFLGASNYSFLRTPLALPLKFGLALAAAVLSYRFIERPFIQYGRRLLSKESPSIACV
jgi:peptidoglycan/LPS O-acetylase OafA/YrhL